MKTAIALWQKLFHMDLFSLHFYLCCPRHSLRLSLSLSLSLSMEAGEPGSSATPTPHAVLYVCVCVVREPAAGSSCVPWGQYTSWQSVIVPEGGVGGRHNAGWHLARLLGSQMLGGRGGRERRAALQNTIDRCENLWLESWPLCFDFSRQFGEDLWDAVANCRPYNQDAIHSPPRQTSTEFEMLM